MGNPMQWYSDMHQYMVMFGTPDVYSGCPSTMIADADAVQPLIEQLREGGNCMEADAIAVNCGLRGISYTQGVFDRKVKSDLAKVSLNEACYNSCYREWNCTDKRATSTAEKFTRYMLGLYHFTSGAQIECADPAACTMPLPKSTLDKESDLRAVVDYMCPPSMGDTCSQSGKFWSNLALQRLGEYPDGNPSNVAPFAADLFEKKSASAVPKFKAYGLGPETGYSVGGVSVDNFGARTRSLFDFVWTEVNMATPLTHINMGDGSFTRSYPFHGLGTGAQTSKAMDIDNDGDLDILLIKGSFDYECGCKDRNGGSTACCTNEVFLNDKGNFTKVEQVIGSCLGGSNSMAAGVLDFDLDGLVDVFMAHETMRCELWHNQGDGTFVDLAAQLGVAYCGFIKGIAIGDLNGDTYPDIAIAGNGSPNYVWINQGGGAFKEVSVELGFQKPYDASFTDCATTFQAAIFDFNNDGHEDLLFAANRSPDAGEQYADFAGETWEQLDEMEYRMGKQEDNGAYSQLFMNNGDGTFTDVSARPGMSLKHTAMAINIGDIDNDGYLDVLMASGAPMFDAFMPDAMLRNVDGDHFEDVTTETGLGHIGNSHGLAFADVNNDGHQDLLKVYGGPGTPYQHDALWANPGANDNTWIKVSLTGVKSNSFGQTAVLKIVDQATGKAVYARQGGTSSFGSNPVAIQHVGLGGAEVVDITVYWPHASKPVDTYTGIAAKTWVHLTEGSATVETKPLTSFPASKFGANYDSVHAQMKGPQHLPVVNVPPEAVAKAAAKAAAQAAA